MNECIFSGRLIHDPELRAITKQDGSETHVVNFAVAVSRKFRKSNGESGRQSTIVDCEVWDSAACLIAEKFIKGSPILVRASARNDSYTNSDGKKVSKIKFRVENFEFVSNNEVEDKVE